MDNVLILGAGIYQVPLIKTAKRLGYRVIVASIPGKYPGFEYADEVSYTDIRDKESLLELARDHNVKAVLTAGTDVAISSIGYICEKLGLPGINEDTGLKVTDKIAMKEAFRDGGVATARFEFVNLDDGIDEAMKVAESIGYPVIFKAIDSSGSRGITKVFEPGEIEGALQNIRENTRSERYLIEELIVGTEFGTQAFVQDGQVVLFMPHGDYLYEGDTAVPAGHYVPFGTTSMEEEARKETQLAIQAVGINDGAANIDAIERDGKVYIIEIGARAGATCLPELVSARFGIDYYDLIVRKALGEHVDVPSECLDVNVCAMLLCPDRPGVVSAVHLPEKVADTVTEVTCDRAPGAVMRHFRVGPDRSGHVVASGASLATLERDVRDAMRGVVVELEAGDCESWIMPAWVELDDE
ncbi:MAG: ATP-grasp domain-containing protein [Eggerthellaceae bacterium]|nr:ATP-grasp domain-containing protein [Eggerthellaceae bacterium]